VRKFVELTSGCMAKAHDDEPTFVLLARDKCAPATIRVWVQLRIGSGKNGRNDAQIIEALALADMMDKEQAEWYQESHKDSSHE
jgi:hypothetical protein